MPASPCWHLAHLRGSPCRSPPAHRPGKMGRQAWWRDGFPHPTGSRGAWLSPGHAAAAMVSVHPFAAPQAPRALTQPALGWYLPRRLPANLLRPVPAPPACPSSPAGRGGGGGGSCGLGTALEGARAGYEPGCGAGRTEQEGSAVLTTRYGVDWAGAAPARGALLPACGSGS